MSTAAAERVSPDLLELHEADARAVGKDGEHVLLHVIRPGVGKGRGRHLYTPEMLRENAEKFTGWKMYVDHLDPEARRKAGGLPRTWRDYGGRIVEAWWDEDVPADPDNGWGQGAVVAKAKPFGLMQEIIEHDPEIAEASISAVATGVRPVTHGGQRVNLVEGIEDKGSVDWVTEAGAGGRVVSLMESLDTEEMEKAMLDQLSEEEFTEYLREHRPQLAEALDAASKPPTENGQRAEENDMEITPEVLTEALQRNPEVLDGLLSERVRPLVESLVSEERDLVRAEARADAERQIKLRDMRDKAYSLVESARLPESFANEVRSKFDLTESGPTPGLDLVDEINDDGEVTKTADARLHEAVTEEIAKQRRMLAEARPTRVVGQGPSARSKDGEQPTDEEKEKSRVSGTLYGAVLEEAGIDASEAYAEV